MFGMDVLAETMESMELEIISLKARLEYWKKRAEKAENALIDIELFGKDATTTKMNYYHGTTSIRPRVRCADGVSLSVQASEYAYCHPRQRYNRHWTTYNSVEVGYIYDKNTRPFSPPDIWREYQNGNDEIWAYVPVSVVEEFLQAHGGEVEAPIPTETQP
jgi:hypothetical protein